jgi:hypothetical protein
VATLIPDVPKDCVRSERMVFERLGRELDASWIILHSLGLTGHEVKIRGEADIVVLSTRGIFVLEVKGGHVSCRDGRWYFGTPGTKEYSRSEDPWSQASGGMFAVRNRIIREAPELAGLLFGFGVVMPMERFTAVGEEIDPNVLLDRRDFGRNLGFYIGNLEKHWRTMYLERQGREPARPTAENIRRIRQILRPDVESSFSLGSWLNGLERDLIQLTNEQIRISRRLESNARMIVSGRAGTGKTVLAVERALSLATKGRSVLFLCFNQLLARHVAENIGARAPEAKITVRHLHGFYRDAISAAKLSERLHAESTGDDAFYSSTFPQIYCEAVMETEPPLYNAVVVDEAQDILTPQHLDAIDLTIDGGLERGTWHFFMDPLQNVYGSLQADTEARLQKLSFARDELTDNCRNTMNVAVQTSIISLMDVPTSLAPKGAPCDPVFYERGNVLARQIRDTIIRLVSQQVAPEDMIILSTRRLEKSALAGVTELNGVEIRDVADAPRPGTIAFSTMHAFKGLERTVVLAIDLTEIGQDEWSMLHYTGLSRARVLLIPFIPRALEGRYSELARAYGNRLAMRS